MEKLHMLHTNSIQNSRWNFYLSVNIDEPVNSQVDGSNLHAKLHTVKVIYCVSLKPCIIIRYYVFCSWVSYIDQKSYFRLRTKKLISLLTVFP